MLGVNSILFFMVLLSLATLLEPVFKKTRIPFSIILILLGFAGSELAVRVFAIDTGIRWNNFHIFVFNVFIPILIFQAALKLEVSALRKDILIITLMALPMMLLATILTAVMIYLGIGHPNGFPWIAALITGAIVSATDPAPILSNLKKNPVSERVSNILEGESLFNDATAVVLFTVFLGLALSSQESVSLGMSAKNFVIVLLGGIFVGMVFAGLSHLLFRLLCHDNAISILILINVYAVYFISDHILGYSGVIALLAFGLLSRYLESATGIYDKEKFSRRFWNFLASLTGSLIFIMAGVTITVAMFTDQWLAILIGIVSVLSARFLLVYFLLTPVGMLPGTDRLSLKQQALISWGGVRGSVTLALALSLPLALEYYYTIQSIAYGVVLFTLFIPSISINLITKK